MKYYLLAFIQFIAFVTVYCQTPNYEWAKTFTGANYDYAKDMVMDKLGNVYIAGYFSSPTLTIDNIVLENYSIHRDGYIAKLNSNGDVLWAKVIGGIGDEEVSFIEIDTMNNIYISGTFGSEPIHIDTTTITNIYLVDIFVAKLNSSGDVLWTDVIGSNNNEGVYGLLTDNNSVYLSGHYVTDTLFWHNDTLINNGNDDFFILKYNETGNPIWSQNIGGSSYDYLLSLECDFEGNLFFSGRSGSDDIIFDTIVVNNPNCFIVKYNSEGNVVNIKTDDDYTWNHLAFDDQNNLYASSRAIDLSVIDDIRISKFNNDLELIWEKIYPGNQDDHCKSICVDGDDVYFTGVFQSDVLQFGEFTLLLDDATDSFLTKMNIDGEVEWSKSIHGNIYEWSQAIETDSSHNLFIVGDFRSNIYFDEITYQSAGLDDIFIAKLNSNTVEIEENANKLDDRFLIYPNPNQGEFFIKGNTCIDVSNINVFDIMGNELKFNLNQGDKTSKITLLDNYQGILLIQILANNDIISYRLISN